MMTISTKGRYACRIMVLLAARTSAGPVTKHEIAAAEAISPDYVQQIMMRLKAAGLAKSYRGREGGFSVAKDPELISISDVLVAMEGRVAPAPCCGEPECCDRADTCPTRDVWMKATQLLEALFEGTTIAGLAGRFPPSGLH
jgi:Rrf2 family protein